MGTVISDRFWTEAPELHITIEYNGPAAPPLGKYTVTRFAGCTPDKIWIGYGSAGRATEAEAREFANGMWAWTVNLIKQNRAGKAQADPFEVVAETVAVEVPAFEFEDNQVHEVGPAVYRVKISKSSGKPYAELLVSTEGKPVWSYTPGSIKALGAGTVMSADRRAEMGRSTTYCLNCGIHLTHPVSIERGMGPICYGKAYNES